MFLIPGSTVPILCSDKTRGGDRDGQGDVVDRDGEAVGGSSVELLEEYCKTRSKVAQTNVVDCIQTTAGTKNCLEAMTLAAVEPSSR